MHINFRLPVLGSIKIIYSDIETKILSTNFKNYNFIPFYEERKSFVF